MSVHAALDGDASDSGRREAMFSVRNEDLRCDDLAN